MGPGDFRERITFQVNAALGTKGAGGAPLEDWVWRGDRWANIAQLSVSKQMRAMAQHSHATHTITIWKEDGLNTAMRIVAGPPDALRIFEVLGMGPAGDRKQFLEFLVAEVQPPTGE